ncbi:MAG: flagellar biosynthesis protein FlhB, partial [Lachnospiraceae bacterium]
SGKKRRDERKKGNIFFSKDIVTVVSLMGSFYILKFFFPYMYRTSRAYLIKLIESVSSITELTDGTLQGILNDILVASGILILPIVFAIIGLAVLSTGIQTKFIFTGKNMAPKFSRLSPLKGIKNLFSLKNVVELLKNCLKCAVLFYILYSVIQKELFVVAKTMDMDISASSIYMFEIIMKMIFKVALAFIAISTFDYFYQWWDYERNIKMSKQDQKEEYKQTEGDPKIKGKIRDLQKQRAMSRMMQSVPTADVIIKNPTHFAVALTYDIDKQNAPIVIAKGQDELALRIIKVGEESGVYVLENKMLARAIYATTKIGYEIPEEYYGTVAEILVYVYQLNNKRFT